MNVVLDQYGDGSVAVGRITLNAAALADFNADLMVGKWKRHSRRDRAPMLHYHRRLFSTPLDGTVFELGDGFSLTFADPQEAWQSHVAGRKRLHLGDGHPAESAPI